MFQKYAWYGEDNLNGFQLDYDPSKGVIRVSYFSDGHFQDEGFFDVDDLIFYCEDDLK